MTRAALALALAALVLAVAGGPSSAAPAASTVCYQLTGPYAKWFLPASVARSAGVPRAVAGTTWTAFASGVACQSQAAAKYLLAKYPAARRTTSGSIRPPLKGFTACSSSSSGQAACVGSNLRTFTLLETGPYGLAQIRRLAATGKLPLK